ncbi:MAG TPA: deoxyribonuclease IV [Gemmatimonadaceae bacterium]
MLLGSHTIDTGGIAMAVRRAGRARMSALQIFTAIPKYYNEKVGVRPERAAAFRAALEETGIAPSAVLAHAAYVLNVATPDEAKWTRASSGLAKELERGETLGILGVCFHPGAATDGDRSAAAQRIALAITQALESVPGRARLLVENTAGAGNTMGRTPLEIAEILAHVPDALRARTGYGLDTCHLFSSGYDLGSSRESLVAVLDEFETTIGERPSFFHLNDSEGERGSNRDRHALVGEGRIGVEPFRWLLHDPRTSGVPLLLETPQKHPEIAEDDATPDPWDVRMVTLLRELAA